MTELTQAFERYCDVVEGMGATITSRLAGPASHADIDRLQARVGVELPTQIREWFSLANGLALDHPGTRTWSSANLFAHLWPRSINEILDWLDQWAGIIDAELAPRSPRIVVPILADQSKWESVLLADCNSTRVVTFDLEDHDSRAGYYHRSLIDFINGCRHCAESGLYDVVDGGVVLSDRTQSAEQRIAWGVALPEFGFDPDGPPPPRLEPMVSPDHSVD